MSFIEYLLDWAVLRSLCRMQVGGFALYIAVLAHSKVACANFTRPAPPNLLLRA
jgi:hypothetical protein